MRNDSVDKKMSFSPNTGKWGKALPAKSEENWLGWWCVVISIIDIRDVQSKLHEEVPHQEVRRHHSEK